MAARPDHLPDWEPSDGDALEPSSGLKAAGWQPLDEPPAQHFNWFWRTVSRWLAYFDDQRTRHALANWRDDVHDSGGGSAATARNGVFWSDLAQRFVAGSDDAPCIRRARTDLRWSTPGTMPSATAVYRFAEKPGTVLVAGCATICWYSTDADTWTVCSAGAPIVHYDATRDRFAAIRLDGGVYRSSDGITFSSLGSIGAMTGQSVMNIRGLACNGSRWVAVGLGDAGTGDMALCKSSDDDGSNWTERTTPAPGGVSNGLMDVVWSSRLDLFVAVGNTGRILTSPDGITWTLRTTGVTESLRQVMELDGLLVVIGHSGGVSVVLVSLDGIAWEPRPVPSGLDLTDGSTSLPGWTSSPIGVIGHAVASLVG